MPTRKMRRRAAMLAAILGLALLHGCGGGDEDRTEAMDRDSLSAKKHALAVPTPDATAIFNWAEKTYPQFFPGHQDNRFAQPYTYRYYPGTGNYLGLDGNAVAVLGPISGGNVVIVGQLGDFSCKVYPSDCVAPAISTQPVDQTIAAPAGASFSVSASGSPAPTFQWQISGNGGASFADIAGAMATTYSIPATTLSDSGRLYRVRVTNQAGEVVSASARLTVLFGTGTQPRLTPSGVTAAHCYAAGSNALVSCASAQAIALSGAGKQDGMLAIAFAYSEVPRPGGGRFARTECVVDNLTGLMWEGKTADGGLRDRQNKFTKIGDKSAREASAYVKAVNDLALCGYSDWRLPAIDELLSLVQFGTTSYPAIDAAWFPNTGDNPYDMYYWASTPYAASYGLLNWRVGFESGAAQGGYGDDPRRVRLVRGGPSSLQAIRFIPSADGSEVTDAKTGLVWRRCVEGMVWGRFGCTGTAREFTHEQALIQARQQQGWRLPNVKELFSLVDLTRSQPSIDETAFPDMPYPWTSFWTATPLALGSAPTNSSNAWNVEFYGGRVNFSSRSERFSVRLVR